MWLANGTVYRCKGHGAVGKDVSAPARVRIPRLSGVNALIMSPVRLQRPEPFLLLK